MTISTLLTSALKVTQNSTKAMTVLKSSTGELQAISVKRFAWLPNLSAKILYYLDPKKVNVRFHYKYMEFELKNAALVDKLIHLGFHNNKKVEAFRGRYEELKKRIEGNDYYSMIES